MSLSEQWGWLVILATIPIIFIVALEMRQWVLRRRQQAVARRRKGPGNNPGRGG